VCAAGLQPAGEQGGQRLAVGIDEALDHLPMRHRLAAARAYGALLARMRMAVEGRIDRAARPLRRAPDQREIIAFDGALALVGKLVAQPPVRTVRLRHHHEASGVLVEPVHDAGPLDAANAGETVAAMRDQRVDQSAARVSRSRMYDEPG